jgi:hypothetical protein
MSISPGEPQPPRPNLPDIGPPDTHGPEIELPDNPDLPRPLDPDLDPIDPKPDVGVPSVPGREIPFVPPEPAPL